MQETPRGNPSPLTAALDGQQMGTWERVLSSELISCSNNIREWYGLQSRGGHTLEAFFAAIHPDDVGHVKQTLAACTERAWEADCEFECRVRGFDGERRIYTRGHVLFNGDGTPEKVLGVAINVTQSRASEATSVDPTRNPFIDVAPDAVLTLDFSGRILSVNPYGQRILEITDAERVVGTSWVDWWDGEHRVEAARALRAARDGATARFSGECATQSGTRRWWSVAITQMADSSSPVACLIVPMRDITQMKAAEDQLVAQAAFAQYVVGIVSHDLRTPLSAIKMATDMLRRRDPDASSDGVLQRIGLATDRAIRMIHDLLDLTQAQLGGGIMVQPKLIDVHAVLRDALAEVHDAHPGRVVELCASGPREAYLDPDRMTQLTVNLVTNALQYSTRDSAVTVNLVCTDDVVLSVHNVGAAIKRTVLPHLFEPMQRGAQHGQTQARSIGLGLYIVKQIAVAHGGQVSVESGEAQGTTFSVRVPRARPTAPSS